ncbi:SGNH/GDSL hydrolase family protein [Tabrizicola oligotrophica]|uniref:Uncharacterized protein n=1 Tax=Tabrizicola oligotrophica TaxID=2710650 RepID=A0A6M0QRS6_9RHOB|nr:SGNH/GDSL hydrolase family protein [Tabrizicola oligotrophica]NEY90185.1 hypothetical protein [Tabrizicola oligotrophica]
MSVFSFLADVLMVGHSLFGGDTAVLTESALREMTGPSVVETQIINGASLAYNWENSAKAEGADARARLATRPADVLILTEAIPVAGHVQWSDTAGNVARFAGLARDANPEVRVYLFEGWPSRASGPGADAADDPDASLPWRERLVKDLPLWQAAAGEGVKVIPAGQALARLEDETAAGRVPGIDRLDDLFSDDIHLNGKGQYFIAMVIAGAITGQSPEGLPARLTRAWSSRDDYLSAAQAAALQRVAWQAVSASAAAAPASAAPKAAPTPQKDPPAQVQALPMGAFAPVTNPNLALGLAGVTDWSVQQPFLDVMKTARPWVGHLPGQWGGWGHDDLAAKGYLDENGWPKALPPDLSGITTLILTDLPEEAGGVAGRYLLTWAGKGTLVLEGRAVVAEAQPGRILFDYTPGEGAVLLTVTAIDPSDPIHDIVVVRQDRAEALAAGQIFNPDWLARIRGVTALRFMDWMATNDSPLSRRSDRPKPADYTWARQGVPMEVMIALANELNADPWFTLPHLSEDALVRDWAELAHKDLNPGLVAHVEYSNEVWNWQFAQARWAEEQGKALWHKDGTWVQFYARRAAEVADIWADVFRDDPRRLMRVIAMQTGWLGLEDQILDAPLVVAEGRKAPVASFDAYAVTGYFSALLGADDKAALVRGWLAQSRDADPAQPYRLANEMAAKELRDGSISGNREDTLARLLAELLPYHAAIAADRGLKLVMYEGGTHVVGFGAQMEDADLTAFFEQLNYAPEMGMLYAELLAGWGQISDQPFNAFVDVYAPGKWGSWGALRHLGDDNPRWQVLAKGCAKC